MTVAINTIELQRRRHFFKAMIRVCPVNFGSENIKLSHAKDAGGVTYSSKAIARGVKQFCLLAGELP